MRGQRSQARRFSDRQFASVQGPTFLNRSYLMAATSFEHVTTNDSVPPVVGYQPITATIFNHLNTHGVTWADYFEVVPQDGSFRPIGTTHSLPLAIFFLDAPGVGTL